MSQPSHREIVHDAINGDYAKGWGHNIKLVRHTRELSQQQVADAIGVDKTTISKIENGDMLASDPLRCLIAHVLDVPIERLFTMPTLHDIRVMCGTKAAA